MKNNNYEGYELTGQARETALAKCRAQIDAWDLTMPPVEPVCFHFGLNDFDRIGLIEFWVANEKNHGYCGKFLFVFDGQMCPYHKHEQKHETFFVLKGEVTMNVNGHEVIKKQGDLLVMPPGVEHSFTGRGAALLLEASSPCLLQDNFFADHKIGTEGVI
jgi:mannose-6-phosphate isomerase-like protein (cupin superfamily)